MKLNSRVVCKCSLHRCTRRCRSREGCLCSRQCSDLDCVACNTSEWTGCICDGNKRCPRNILAQVCVRNDRFIRPQSVSECPNHICIHRTRCLKVDEQWSTTIVTSEEAVIAGAGSTSIFILRHCCNVRSRFLDSHQIHLVNCRSVLDVVLPIGFHHRKTNPTLELGSPPAARERSVKDVVSPSQTTP